MKTICLLLVSLIITLTGCGGPENAADIVILNGTVATLDDAQPNAEAVAVTADTITAVGSNEEIEDFIGSETKVLKLNGEFVMPGFNDSHGHFISMGRSLMSLNLKDAKNWDEAIFLVTEAAEKAAPGEWIIGRGWHQEKWNPIPIPNVEGYPVHNALSNAVPRNPVMLSHASGHALIANAYAMRLAGIDIDSTTADPPGGRIVRDSAGIPIGVFEEDAEKLIADAYAKVHSNPAAKRKLWRRQIKLAEEKCLQYGITSFQDAGSSIEQLKFYKELADSGKLRVRLYVMLYEDPDSLMEKFKDYQPVIDNRGFFTTRSIKLYIDGALGSRGALFEKPYSDSPDHYGFIVTPIDKLREFAKYAIENELQVCTHAIGDEANHIMLNIYQKQFETHPDKTGLRWRIEHAQHLLMQDIPRFGAMGVIAAMQGIHCTSDAVFVIKRLGKERAKRGAYVWRKLIDTGAVICNGTDVPVEDANTIENYYALVTRKLPDGSSFFPDQKMSRIEALRSYTLNGAYASFSENVKGSITPGKLADITILSQNITSVPDDDILNTEILFTIVGGKIEYSLH